MHGPIVNLNGETRQSLIGKYRDVHDTARALYRALAAASPHGRDYQTAPAGLCATDTFEHRRHREKVDDIIKTYERILVRLVTEE